MNKIKVKHYVKKEKEWTIVFIPNSPLKKNEFGEIFGNIFNLRRKYSRHKRISITWRNLKKFRANLFTGFCIREKELEQDFIVYNKNYKSYFEK